MQFYDRKNAVQTQSYGAEARGSATKSEVIISDDRIGFPIVRKCDVLIAMNQEALDKYLKDLKEDGILIADTTNIKKTQKHKLRYSRFQRQNMLRKHLARKSMQTC